MTGNYPQDESSQEIAPDSSEDIDNFEDPIKTYLEWKALSRPFRKKHRSFYTTVAILIILFLPIAYFFGGLTLFLALLAMGFAVYVFNLVAPEEINYKLSTQGVTVGEHFYHWNELNSFWINQKDGHMILNLVTNFRFPALLMVILNQDQVEEVKRICAKYLPFHEIPPKSFIDKWVEILQKHFPLETPHH